MHGILYRATFYTDYTFFCIPYSTTSFYDTTSLDQLYSAEHTTSSSMTASHLSSITDIAITSVKYDEILNTTNESLKTISPSTEKDLSTTRADMLSTQYYDGNMSYVDGMVKNNESLYDIDVTTSTSYYVTSEKTTDTAQPSSLRGDELDTLPSQYLTSYTSSEKNKLSKDTDQLNTSSSYYVVSHISTEVDQHSTLSNNTNSTQMIQSTSSVW
jgi:hypothetical protein